MGQNVLKYDRTLDQTQSEQKVSRSDIIILEKLRETSLDHMSGGSYNMVAKWVKGSRSALGFNKLDRRATTINDAYPEICGVHAELDLFYKLPPVKGGTVYVAGSRARTLTFMPNTSPCIYCKTILAETYVRYIVFYNNNQPIKMPLIKWSMI
jgi:hypothetical protein